MAVVPSVFPAPLHKMMRSAQYQGTRSCRAFFLLPPFSPFFSFGLKWHNMMCVCHVLVCVVCLWFGCIMLCCVGGGGGGVSVGAVSFLCFCCVLTAHTRAFRMYTRERFKCTVSLSVSLHLYLFSSPSLLTCLSSLRSLFSYVSLHSSPALSSHPSVFAFSLLSLSLSFPSQ